MPVAANPRVVAQVEKKLGPHYQPEVIEVAEKCTAGMISFWKKISAKMLPTPAKFHYIFNVRDLSRISQVRAPRMPPRSPNTPHTLSTPPIISTGFGLDPGSPPPGHVHRLPFPSTNGSLGVWWAWSTLGRGWVSPVFPPILNGSSLLHRAVL